MLSSLVKKEASFTLVDSVVDLLNLFISFGPLFFIVSLYYCVLLFLAFSALRDVGAAFARLQPGMGIKPHLWNAPPRTGTTADHGVQDSTC